MKLNALIMGALIVCCLFLALETAQRYDLERLELKRVEYNKWVRECRAAKTGCNGWYGQGEK